MAEGRRAITIWPGGEEFVIVTVPRSRCDEFGQTFRTPDRIIRTIAGGLERSGLYRCTRRVEKNERTRSKKKTTEGESDVKDTFIVAHSLLSNLHLLDIVTRSTIKEPSAPKL